MLEITGVLYQENVEDVESLILNFPKQIHKLGNWRTIFKKLKKLHLSHIYGETYPLTIKLDDMPVLEEITLQTADLSWDFLTFVSDKKAIKRLSLRLCNLTKFPKELLEYTNLEHLDLCYNDAITELPDALFQLPNLKSFSFGNENITDEDWEKIIMQISKNPNIKTLCIACFPRLPKNIAVLKNIVSLEIASDRFGFWRDSKNITEIGNVVLFSAELVKFANLETLIFSYYHNYNVPFDFDFQDIAKMKHLHTLKLRVKGMQMYQWELLKQIKKLELNINDNFSSTVLPEKINEMESLEELHLIDAYLKDLPLSPKLKNFHTLVFNFSWKSRVKGFETVSNDFLRLLPQIKRLELNDIPSTGSVKIIKELQQVFSQIPEKSTFIVNIITKNNTEKYTTNELLDILYLKKAQIDKNTWILIEKRLEDDLLENTKNNIFQLENVKTYFLLGKSTKSTELNNILKSLDWKAVKDSKKADCIVVSRECKPNCSIDFDAKKAVSDTYLLAWVEKKTGFERFDESVNDNLLLLLKSEDAANQILALNMLSNAYTPSKEIDACLMAMALFAPNKELKVNTKKFIEKNFSNELLTEFKKHNRRGHEKEGYEIIKNNPLLDMLSFAEMSFLCTYNKHRYRGFGYIDIIALGGSMMPVAMKVLQWSNHIAIDNELTAIHADFIKCLPSEPHIIICWNYMPKVQKEVFKILNTNEIHFEHPYLSKMNFLHEDIGNLQSLKKIEFKNPLIPEFPTTLAKLPDVKHLDLHNDILTAIPDVFSTWKNLEYLEISTQSVTTLPDWLGNLQKVNTCKLFFKGNLIAIDPVFEMSNLINLTIRGGNVKLEKSHQILPYLKQIMIEVSGETEEGENSKKSHYKLLEQIIDICPATLTDFSFYSKCNIISDKILKFKDLTALHLSGDFEQIPTFITDLPLTNLTLKSDILKDIAFLETMKNLEMVTLSVHLNSQRKKLQEKMPKVQFRFHQI